MRVISVKYISEIHVKLEGECNTFWTFHYSDGDRTEYWSCDSGPIELLSDNIFDQEYDEMLQHEQDRFYDLHVRAIAAVQNIDNWKDKIINLKFRKMMFRPYEIEVIKD